MWQTYSRGIDVFKVEVTEVLSIADGEPEHMIVRFTQMVDELNIRAVIAATNLRPRKAREPKAQPAKKEAK
jgi:hypothetical protein